VKNASVNKEGGQESPIPALHQVVEAEDEVLLGKLWVLLPSPETCHYASDYEKRVDSQVVVGPLYRSLPDLQGEDENRHRKKKM
jgi:hypothetical protein